MVSAASYGESAPELRALKKVVLQRCPTVRFHGFRVNGARYGEIAFTLPPYRKGQPVSFWVRSPTGPAGYSRGRWRYRLSKHGRFFQSWQEAATMDEVVNCLRRLVEEREY